MRLNNKPYLKNSTTIFQIKLGYYNQGDWEKFVNMVDDKENLHSNWEDWNQAFHDSKKKFTKLGFEVVKVVVDLDKLAAYCKAKGLKNTGATRSKFIQQS